MKQVVRCCLEHAASVARTFLTSDAVVVDIKEPQPFPMRKPMPTSGNKLALNEFSSITTVINNKFRDFFFVLADVGPIGF